MMKKLSKLSIPSVAALVLAVGCQSANDPFDIADTDKDGKISYPEFERFMLEAIYTEADANEDSKVTYEEWRVINPKADKEKFKQPDKNKDGNITPEELKEFTAEQETLMPLFKKIDTNGDKGLDRAEVEEFYKKAEQAAGTTTVEKISNAS